MLDRFTRAWNWLRDWCSFQMGTVSIWVHPPEEIPVGIDGVSIEIHGIRAMHVPPAATRIELPTFRDAVGRSRAAIILPEEVRGPIGDAVLDRLVELGLAVRRSRQAA